MRRADRLAGLVTIAAGATLGLLGGLIETSPAQAHTLSARFFPILLSLALVCLGTLLALRPGPATLRAAAAAVLARRGLALVALVLAYFLAFRDVDFRLGSWAFMLAAMWLLGSRRLAELAIVPPLVALGVFAVFRYGFEVLLPTWT